MGFFSNLVGATIKTALTPIAIVKDVVDVVAGEEADNTISLLNAAKNNVVDALDDLTEGEL